MTRIERAVQRFACGVSCAVCAVLLSGAASAQLSVPWSTVDGGGAVSVGASFTLEGTIGQHDVGAGQSGGAFCLVTAYWEGGRLNGQCPGDLNADNAVDTLDLVDFLGAFGSLSPCGGGADFNFDGAVNTVDLTVFLGNYGRTCN